MPKQTNPTRKALEKRIGKDRLDAIKKFLLENCQKMPPDKLVTAVKQSFPDPEIPWGILVWWEAP